MGKISVQLLFMRIYVYIRYLFEDWSRGRLDYFAIGKVLTGRKISMKIFYVLNDRLQFKKAIFTTSSFPARPELS